MTDVTITLPGSNTQWVFTNAEADANGDDSKINLYQMAMANVGKVMVDVAQEVDNYSTVVQWNAHALDAIQSLSTTVSAWGPGSVPKTADILKLYEAGVIAATPGEVEISFQPPGKDQGFLPRPVLIEAIKNAPPDYPGSYASMEPGNYYLRLDGTYFWYGMTQKDGPKDGPYGEIQLDPANASYQATNPAGLPISDWVSAFSARKDELTQMSQTQMAYLQDRSELYDRLVTFMTSLIEALKKIVTTLVK